MKKFLVLLIAVILVFSVTACGSKKETKEENNKHSWEEMEDYNIISNKNNSSSQSESSKTSESSKSENKSESKVESTVNSESLAENEILDVESNVESEIEKTNNDLRPEFKDAMDAYEEFYDEYCELMLKYSENPTDLTILSEYSEMMGKALEFDEKIAKWENEEMNDAELEYYLEVTNRVTKKLLDAQKEMIG